jgi:hypothetical protein
MAQYIESLDFPPAPTPTVDTPAEDHRKSWFWKSWLEAPAWIDAEVEVSVATYQAYQILYYAFVVLMGVAGLDKFMHVLTTWEAYVSPAMSSFLHLSPGVIAGFAGLIELLAAAAVALKPRIGSWVVTVWLGFVVVNLLTMSGHADTVLCDLALMASGFAFTRLAAECN